jgi:hypothetical protein
MAYDFSNIIKKSVDSATVKVNNAVGNVVSKYTTQPSVGSLPLNYSIISPSLPSLPPQIPIESRYGYISQNGRAVSVQQSNTTSIPVRVYDFVNEFIRRRVQEPIKTPSNNAVNVIVSSPSRIPLLSPSYKSGKETTKIVLGSRARKQRYKRKKRVKTYKTRCKNKIGMV